MKKLQQIEKLTGGKALLERHPANGFFPSPHWYLQTADDGKFGNISKRELLDVVLDFLENEGTSEEENDL